MKLKLLGGADEIGSSSTLVEVANTKILIDCGMRHHERAGERIPAFSEIGKDLDAIILTHAHLDHSGALPVVASSYPNTPIYLTQPTLAIVSVLLLDSLKIMQLGLEADGEVPIYSLQQIENALSACRPISFNTKLKIKDLEITFRPAGHILGAASVVIESDEGSIVMSGDVHAIDQLTVPALAVPHHRPDIFVIESTYGDKLHASRALEEKRLIERIRTVVEGKGSVLIPAFAVGRSQELILLVSRAIEQGELPKIPVYIDGLVKNVCGVYSSFPYLMTNWLQKRIKDKGNPFFQDKGIVTPIYDPKSRKDVARERSSVVISSSGMVTVGSPSSFYAGEFSRDPRCLIAISGYQDEESPGRKMLELAEKGGGKLPTTKGEVPLFCAIEKFSFSAHSDAYQVTSELEASKPRRVVLVHGDGGAREALAKHLSTLGFKDIRLPNLGGEIDISGRREKQSQIAFSSPINADNANNDETVDSQHQIATTESLIATNGNLQTEHLNILAEKLAVRDGGNRAYTITEILVSAGYEPNQINSSELERVKIILKAKNSPFSQDKSSRLTWRLRLLPGNRIATKVANITEQEVMTVVRKAFASESTFYKVSIDKSKRIITARFYFPKPIMENSYYKHICEQIEQETGWLVEIANTVHQEELSKVAMALIPVEWEPKSPSFIMDKSIVAVKATTFNQKVLDEINKALEQKTGFKLDIQLPKVIASSPITLDASGQVVKQKLEINAAYAKVKEIFASKAHPLLKVGLKGEAIELTFVTPEIGKRYAALMKEIGDEIGYTLQVRQSADQVKLKEIIRDILPKEAILIGEPSINLAKQEITIKLAPTLVLNAKDTLKLKEAFFDQTGWQLLIKD